MFLLFLLLGASGLSAADDFFPKRTFDGLSVLEEEWGKPVYRSIGWDEIGPVAQFQKGSYALTVLTDKWDEMPIFIRLKRTDNRPLSGQAFEGWRNQAFLLGWSKAEELRRESSNDPDGAKIYKRGLMYAKVYPDGMTIDIWKYIWQGRYGSKRPEVVQPMIARAPVK